MDCSELYDFLSSSSLSSSSDSEAEVGGHRRHDTDREGDDELTDWPGNEFGPGARYDPKRKLTKKSLLPQIRSDDTIGEDDTLMSGTEAGAVGMEPTPKSPAQLPESLQDLSRFQPTSVSEPIEILNAGSEMETNADGTMPASRQIESEMSGERLAALASGRAAPAAAAPSPAEDAPAQLLLHIEATQRPPAAAKQGAALKDQPHGCPGTAGHAHPKD